MRVHAYSTNRGKSEPSAQRAAHTEEGSFAGDQGTLAVSHILSLCPPFLDAPFRPLCSLSLSSPTTFRHLWPAHRSKPSSPLHLAIEDLRWRLACGHVLLARTRPLPSPARPNQTPTLVRRTRKTPESTNTTKTNELARHTTRHKSTAMQALYLDADHVHRPLRRAYQQQSCAASPPHCCAGSSLVRA